MELLCPHCFKKVTVPDERAGQVINCPLCTKAFGAPALAPPLVVTATPAAPSPPSQSPSVGAETYGLSAPPPLPPPSPNSVAERPLVAPPPPVPAPPPPPPGEYTRSTQFHLRGEVLTWLIPALLTLVFVLSFFPWHSLPPASLWQLAFTERGSSLFLVYLLLTVLLAWPLSVASLLLERGVIPEPPALRPWRPWKFLVVGAVLGVGLVLMGFDYLQQHFYMPENEIAIAMKVAVRLHALALVCCAAEAWLQYRTRRNLPLPRAELRW
jgi:hypothetical protein